MIPVPLLTIDGETLTFANSSGMKLVCAPIDGAYGRVSLFLRDERIGHLEMLKNARTGYTDRNPPYHRIAEMNYRMSAYEVLENSGTTARVRFSGQGGYIGLAVTLTVGDDGAACRLDHEIRAEHPFGEVSDPPFTEIAFSPAGSKFMFTQYPFQVPLTRAEEGEMDIVPQGDFVPFMFSKRRVGRTSYFLGAGYSLGCAFRNGRMRYSNSRGGGVFRIHPVETPGVSGNTVVHGTVVSFAESQAACISGYRGLCGYDISTPPTGRIDESEALLMSVYRNSGAFLDGKGFHQQINFDTGEPPRGSLGAGAYGKFVPVCANVALAYNLYTWWAENPGETWAKEKALVMVDFFMESQRSHGGVPNLYHPDQGRYITYVQYVKEKRAEMGKESPHFPGGVFLYTVHMMSMAAYFLLRFYFERIAIENTDCPEWKRSAVAAMDYLAERVGSDGLTGRNYTEEGKFDDTCANAWLLVALDYFHSRTGDAKYDRVRRRLEAWVDRTFAEIDHWYNWSADGGFWLGDGFPPINHDAFEIPTYATYCLYRYLKTKNGRYLGKAKDALEYLWLCMIPLQFPDYLHATKGLVKEQDTYSTYDVPFNTTRLFDCLPYLSLVEKDDFYMAFYRLMIRLQIGYQAVDRKFPAFYIGLDWVRKDVLGEENVGYISEFAGCVFIASIRSRYCYRYVRGKDSCIGLDADPVSCPDPGEDGAVLLYGTCSVKSSSWDAATRTLLAHLEGRPGKPYSIGIRPGRGLSSGGRIVVRIDGKPARLRPSALPPSSGVVECEFEMPADRKIVVELVSRPRRSLPGRGSRP